MSFLLIYYVATCSTHYVVNCLIFQLCWIFAGGVAVKFVLNRRQTCRDEFLIQENKDWWKLFIVYFCRVSYLSFFAFSYPCNSRESIVFCQIFETEIFWWIKTFWGPLNPKITLLPFSLCVSVISITLKQITTEASNLVFYICIMYRCYLKRFIKIGQIICIQRYTKIFECITPSGQNYLLVFFTVFNQH